MLEFHVLVIEPNTVRRKIFEAMKIQELNPTINLKEELSSVLRLLAERPRI